MKVKIAEKFRLVALILTVLLGFVNPTAQAFEVSGQSLSTVSAVQIRPTQIVEVVSSIVEAKIVTANEENPAPKSLTACTEPQLRAYSLIQGQTGINLNQPASCFRLAVSQPAALPKISVSGVQRSSVKIVVQVLPTASLSVFHFWPFKSAEENPAQIPYLAALLTSLFIFSYRSFGERNKIFKSFSPKINKFGILVLRC